MSIINSSIATATNISPELFPLGGNPDSGLGWRQRFFQGMIPTCLQQPKAMKTTLVKLKGASPWSKIDNVHQKLNGTLPTDLARAISYSGLGVRSVGPVGDFLETGKEWKEICPIEKLPIYERKFFLCSIYILYQEPAIQVAALREDVCIFFMTTLPNLPLSHGFLVPAPIAEVCWSGIVLHAGKLTELAGNWTLGRCFS